MMTLTIQDLASIFGIFVILNGMVIAAVKFFVHSIVRDAIAPLDKNINSLEQRMTNSISLLDQRTEEKDAQHEKQLEDSVNFNTFNFIQKENANQFKTIQYKLDKIQRSHVALRKKLIRMDVKKIIK